jgi:large subunit ribosomal protein L10
MKRKEAGIEEIKEKFAQAKIAILTDYRGDIKGMTVKSITNLRRKLRETKSECSIFKNTLSKIAIKGSDAEVLSDHFKQPTAIVFGFDDPAATSKALVNFIDEQKENKLPLIRIGFMDGKLIDESVIKTLSTLPPKNVILGNLLRAMNGPTQGLVNVLNGVPRALVIALSEIKKQKEESQA